MADYCGKPCDGCHCHESQNGEILGMATSNKFDLNDPRKIEGYSDDQLYELGKRMRFLYTKGSIRIQP